MAVLELFNSLDLALHLGQIDLSTAQLRVALCAASDEPDLGADTVLSDLTEISYTDVSSRDAVLRGYTYTPGYLELELQPVLLSVSGSVSFRWAVLYDADTDNLIGKLDLGSLSLTSGDVVVVHFPAAFDPNVTLGADCVGYFTIEDAVLSGSAITSLPNRGSAGGSLTPFDAGAEIATHGGVDFMQGVGANGLLRGTMSGLVSAYQLNLAVYTIRTGFQTGARNPFRAINTSNSDSDYYCSDSTTALGLFVAASSTVNYTRTLLGMTNVHVLEHETDGSNVRAGRAYNMQTSDAYSVTQNRVPNTFDLLHRNGESKVRRILTLNRIPTTAERGYLRYGFGAHASVSLPTTVDWIQVDPAEYVLTVWLDSALQTVTGAVESVGATLSLSLSGEEQEVTGAVESLDLSVIQPLASLSQSVTPALGELPSTTTEAVLVFVFPEGVEGSVEGSVGSLNYLSNNALLGLEQSLLGEVGDLEAKQSSLLDGLEQSLLGEVGDLTYWLEVTLTGLSQSVTGADGDLAVIHGITLTGVQQTVQGLTGQLQREDTLTGAPQVVRASVGRFTLHLQQRMGGPQPLKVTPVYDPSKLVVVPEYSISRLRTYAQYSVGPVRTTQPLYDTWSPERLPELVMWMRAEEPERNYDFPWGGFSANGFTFGAVGPCFNLGDGLQPAKATLNGQSWLRYINANYPEPGPPFPTSTRQRFEGKRTGPTGAYTNQALWDLCQVLRMHSGTKWYWAGTIIPRRGIEAGKRWTLFGSGNVLEASPFTSASFVVNHAGDPASEGAGNWAAVGGQPRAFCFFYDNRFPGESGQVGVVHSGSHPPLNVGQTYLLEAWAEYPSFSLAINGTTVATVDLGSLPLYPHPHIRFETSLISTRPNEGFQQGHFDMRDLVLCANTPSERSRLQSYVRARAGIPT